MLTTATAQTVYHWTCDQSGTQLDTVQSGVPDGWAHVIVNGTDVDLCPTCAGPFVPAWEASQTAIAANTLNAS